ncbi:hypothetical protein CIHG_09771 [Coccidioides immitis H538.4]|uniref:Uncharacterized protein n=2 Tax=Coccidioides immitis TaxID=5501 RepID=A0A0J8S3G9_COCIT|nr:hypothetical protein CIRG_06607 [Coccidioides immitis RMSCC 2394]KMU92000.1 hypothetical protein CIHG_09771 [Coccidioides immitis H538.4]
MFKRGVTVRRFRIAQQNERAIGPVRAAPFCTSTLGRLHCLVNLSSASSIVESMSSRSEGAMEVGMHGSVVTEVLEDQHPSGLEASPTLRRKGERQKIQSS